LSIIDLTQGGHQPFVSRDGNYSLVFNGEIYNYRELRNYLVAAGYSFATSSDTEVLLNSWIHWGIECLPKLKGMFAFVVYEKREKLLTLVRDAFGIKPLFYYQNEREFSFASEINALKSLISESLKPNDQKMFEYISFGRSDDNQETFYEGIKSLEPGHILKIDLSVPKSTKKISRWWLPDILEDKSISRYEAVGEIRERFLNNIKLHLISDVPLGAALSGGIDSSSIVCAMRYLEPELDIHTFSYVAPEDRKNEEFWVDIVNNHVNAKSHKVLISPRDFVEDIDEIIKYQGEPFGSTSIYAQYRVYKLAKESGVTVTLDGQGADELFAGYSGYPEWRVRSLLSKGNIYGAVNFLLNWRKEPGRSLYSGIQKSIAINLPKSLFSVLGKFSSNKTSTNLYETEKLQQLKIETEFSLGRFSEIGWERALVGRLKYALTNGELTQLLRYVDRNSMRWSVESRVPFLTTDFAEFVLKLPEDLLISKEGVTKSVFKEAMRGIVPDQILNRRDKIGFETPDLEWLRFLEADLDLWMDGFAEIPWININNTHKYFKSIFRGEEKFSWLAWRMINAAKWSQLLLQR
jgi:asparagine synthase (glutamine-hydrolysing)